MSKKLVLTFMFVLFGLKGEAHKNQPHYRQQLSQEKANVENESTNSFKEINEAYLKSVKPIFKKSCFDCHSSATSYPWYSGIPGVKQLIASDIGRAKEHISMDNDFPFLGHGTPVEDLKSIAKEVKDDEMPPFRYTVMHPRAKVHENDKKIILEWVENSLQKLEGKNP